MSAHRRQRGMTIVPAIFLLVVVGALAAFAIRVGTSQRQSGTFALMGDRALAAANAGVEWAAYRALVNNSCVAGPTNLALNQGALRGFRVAVTCTQTNHTEASTYQVYDVDSLSQWGSFGTPDYVSRRVQKRFTNSPLP